MSKHVFFPYEALKGLDKTLKEKQIDISNDKYALYVIRNAYGRPSYKTVPDRTVDIVIRSIDAMINARNMGDLYQLYLFARSSQGDFNLAYIPETYVSKAREVFDSPEMKKLFDLGFNEAASGYPWRKSPPGLE
jgi:hypothetical protein